MILPCIEAKRSEESIFSCTWLLQQTAAIGRHCFLAQKLEGKIVSVVSVHCIAHRVASACFYAAADLYSMVCENAKAL